MSATVESRKPHSLIAAAMPSSRRWRNSAEAPAAGRSAFRTCAVVTVARVSLPVRHGWNGSLALSWYTGVPSVWYDRVPPAGGVRDYRDTDYGTTNRGGANG